MHTREISLLLLLAAIVFSYRGTIIESVVGMAPVPAVNVVAWQKAGEWRYDSAALYYGFLPRNVQRYRSPAPAEAADAICQAFGGHLDFIREPAAGREYLGFNCKFQEPGLTITADFGDLRRIPVYLE